MRPVIEALDMDDGVKVTFGSTEQIQHKDQPSSSAAIDTVKLYTS